MTPEELKIYKAGAEAMRLRCLQAARQALAKEWGWAAISQALREEREERVRKIETIVVGDDGYARFGKRRV